MTQALNLANFANNLNTSGATSNAGLQNSSVTVTAGTGLSGGGAVSLGGSVSLANAGVTSIVAGTGISISGATGAVTITNSSSGGVSSINGQTGAVVTTTLGNIGSIIFGAVLTSTTLGAGSTISGGSVYYPSTLVGTQQTTTMNNKPTWYDNGTNTTAMASGAGTGGPLTANGIVYNVAGASGVLTPSGGTTLSGTWRLLTSVTAYYQSNYNYGCGVFGSNMYVGTALLVRVS